VDVLLGTADPLGTYVFQASWALGLLALGRLIQSVATRRVVVQGG
jgi:ABC-2 type transport system permease protein